MRSGFILAALLFGATAALADAQVQTVAAKSKQVGDEVNHSTSSSASFAIGVCLDGVRAPISSFINQPFVKCVSGDNTATCSCRHGCTATWSTCICDL